MIEAVCNRDCFNCPYEDCVVDELTMADRRELKEIDAEFVNPKSSKQKKIAAKKREYYQANKDEIAAYQREYYQRRKARREGTTVQPGLL